MLLSAVFAVMQPKLLAKYTEGNDERRGRYDKEKLRQLGGERPFWIHAVSVGEVQAASPLIQAARESGFRGPIVLSTTTETGKAMAMRLGGGKFDLHIYYPWDTNKFVKSALDSINPCAFAAMETELWPNMLWELRERKIPSFLVNGRISDRTYKIFRSPVKRKIIRGMFDLFTGIYLRGDEDKNRLLELGGIAESKIRVAGDCKIDALLARRDDSKGAGDIFSKIFGGPLFIAGSTHSGEEQTALDAYYIVRKEVPRARLIIAPRHPERAEQVKSLVPREIRSGLSSEDGGGLEILIIDKIGVLFDLYASVSAAFVGGSLVKKGGQNILEPAVWGVPVQHGPYIDDFADAAREFAETGLAQVVNNAEDLARAWLEIAREDSGKEKYSALSRAYFQKRAGASRRAWDGIRTQMRNC